MPVEAAPVPDTKHPVAVPAGTVASTCTGTDADDADAATSSQSEGMPAPIPAHWLAHCAVLALSLLRFAETPNRSAKQSLTHDRLPQGMYAAGAYTVENSWLRPVALARKNSFDGSGGDDAP